MKLSPTNTVFFHRPPSASQEVANPDVTEEKYVAINSQCCVVITLLYQRKILVVRRLIYEQGTALSLVDPDEFFRKNKQPGDQQIESGKFFQMLQEVSEATELQSLLSLVK